MVSAQAQITGMIKENVLEFRTSFKSNKSQDYVTGKGEYSSRVNKVHKIWYYLITRH